MAISPTGRIRFEDFLSPRPGEPPRERRGLPTAEEARGGTETAPRIGEAVTGDRRPNGPPHLGTRLDVTA